MADRATLAARLLEAEEAYHLLSMGQGLVKIRHNEREMTYAQADAGKLSSYIGDLTAQIARLDSGLPVTARRGRSRAIFF